MRRGNGVTWSQCTDYPANVGAQVGRGALHSSPSTSIESCAGVSKTEPSFVTGQVNRPLLQPLGEQAEALAIPVQNLDEVTSAAAKAEDGA